LSSLNGSQSPASRCLKQNERSREGRADAGKPRDATVNFDRYGVCRQLFFSDTFSSSWHATITRYSDIVQ